jgi:hypothetical protein
MKVLVVVTAAILVVGALVVRIAAGLYASLAKEVFDESLD